MLKVYAVEWCPHCRMTVQFLRDKNVEFEYLDLERQPPDVVRAVVRANGGKEDDDWVVPTLENDGKWRPGKVFDPEELKKDLAEMGVKIER